MLYVRMASLKIEDSCVSGPKYSSEVHEAMKMNSSILMMLSSNDALSCKFCKQIHNFPRVEVSALGVSDESILKLPAHVVLGPEEKVEMIILFSTFSGPRAQLRLYKEAYSPSLYQVVSQMVHGQPPRGGEPR